MHYNLAQLPVNGTLPPQDNYQVRLVDGFSDYDGRVELLANKQWGTICDNGWGITDANVRYQLCYHQQCICSNLVLQQVVIMSIRYRAVTMEHRLGTRNIRKYNVNQ